MRLMINGAMLNVMVYPNGLVFPVVSPEKPTIVLVHGALMDSLVSYYLTLAPGLSAEGMNVLLYDLPGHGRSACVKHGLRLEPLVADLSAIMDLLVGNGPVHLLGNSFGAAVAMAYACTHADRVASVTLVEGEPPTEGWRKAMGHAFRTIRENDNDRALAEIGRRYGPRIARQYRRAAGTLRNTTIVEDVAQSVLPDISRMASLKLPVFALFGGASNNGACERTCDFARQWDDFRYEVLDGYGHGVLGEAPARVLGSVLAFLRVVEPRLASSVSTS